MTYRNAVYDVTDFVENHPGGMKRIMLAGASRAPLWAIALFPLLIHAAAGGSIDQYWNMYAVHRQEQVDTRGFLSCVVVFCFIWLRAVPHCNALQVLSILESHRIGNVAPKDRKPDSAFVVDLFANEPSRSSELTVVNPKPYR